MRKLFTAGLTARRIFFFMPSIEQKHQWYLQHKRTLLEKRRCTFLKEKYNLTCEQYDEMLADQLWGCAICGRSQTHKYKLSVDHNHFTGVVRGIVCQRCNTALGVVENKKLVTKLTQYLK